MVSPSLAAGLGTLLFSSDPELRRRLAAKLLALGHPVLAERDTTDFLALATEDSAPNLLIVDIDDGTILGDPRLFEARERMAGVPLVIISGTMPPERVRLLLRLKAGDWLQKPFSDSEFAQSITQAEGTSAVARSAHVTTFVPASGGAGATTMALMAAKHLSQVHGAGSTCIVDLDFQSANCGLFLDKTSELDLDALVASPSRFDLELLVLLRLERGPGLAIYSFRRPDLFFLPTGRDFVLKLLDLATLRHRQVVIDLPALRTPWFADVVRGSDRVAAVFEPNVPSLSHAQQTLRDLQEIGGGAALNAIANKTSFKLFGNVIDAKAIRKMTGTTPLFFVGRNDETAANAINRALFPDEVAKTAPLVNDAAKAFAAMFSTGRSPVATK
jgi:pilus assembly protein CpaE